MPEYEVLEHITDGVLWVDDKWCFRYVNPSAERLLRRSRQSLLGTLFWDQYPDTIGTAYERCYRTAAETHVLQSVTEYYAPLETWFEVRAFPARRGVVLLFRDVGAEHIAQLELERQALQDELTGLCNRRALIQQLERTIADHPSGRATLLFLDLSRFKEINDAFGHTVGDFFLAEVAQRLRATVDDPQITLARIGGDEFIVLLKGATDQEAIALAERLIAAIAVPIGSGQVVGTLGVSVGIAHYPDTASTAHALLRNADTAMYEAKRTASVSPRVFSKDEVPQLVHRLRLRAELRHALASGQFVLFFQPQLDCASSEVMGFEALLRWRHPELGLLLPADFLDLLLASAVYADVSVWVIGEACRQVARWHAAGHPGLRVAINLSAGDVQNPRLLETVQGALSAAGVTADALDLEVTETAVLEDFQAAASNLSRLRELGAMISLDDFGTGYSSLAYLANLPVDRIKIDRSFIHELASPMTAPRARSMVEAIIALAGSLGMGTIAEGVETLAQRDLLDQAGCDQIQGWWVGAPTESDDALAFLKGHRRDQRLTGDDTYR